ncbi:PQQ-binding-like beta-propeller repeat protein [uncultured Methanolobus sp.]|uniref:WD40 repeat domain-containing protein n=1 Tax=uncultured Methanolobus sp. TaxID=218300 RepID=UPI0029C755F4|nr:PQQ-binding-like beta-propeller repeat protein [uncultured Methanolobus sp.]
MIIKTGIGLGYGIHSKLSGNLNFGELLKSYINVGRGFASISSDGQYISSVEGKIIVCKENKLTDLNLNINNAYADVSISPEGKYFAIVVGHEVVFFSRESGELWHQELDAKIKCEGGLSRNGEHVQSLSNCVKIESNHISVSSNGEYIAVADCMSNIYLFNKNGKLVWRVDSDQEEYAKGTSGAVAISPDGLFIATYQSSSYDVRGDIYPKLHKIQLLDNTGEIVWEHGTNISDNKSGRSFEFTSISISSNGKFVVIGEKLDCSNHDEGCVVLFNSDGDILWTYVTKGFVYGVSISSDGQYIAMHTEDEISLLDYQGHMIWTCCTHDIRDKYAPRNHVTSVSISADGSYVVASTWDGTVHVFKNHINGVSKMSTWGPEISTSSSLPFDPNESIRL